MIFPLASGPKGSWANEEGAGSHVLVLFNQSYSSELKFNPGFQIPLHFN